LSSELTKETRPWHYKLVGREAVPCSLVEWATGFESDTRHVADNEYKGVRVSTVFLGLDHAFGEGPPLLFETMIFGGEHNEYQTRCTTWEQAEVMHLNAMQMVKKSLD